MRCVSEGGPCLRWPTYPGVPGTFPGLALTVPCPRPLGPGHCQTELCHTPMVAVSDVSSTARRGDKTDFTSDEHFCSSALEEYFRTFFKPHLFEVCFCT